MSNLEHQKKEAELLVRNIQLDESFLGLGPGTDVKDGDIRIYLEKLTRPEFPIDLLHAILRITLN